MRRSLVISVAAHVIVLMLCLVTLVFSPPAATPQPQTIPVSTISVTDFTELTQGVANAPPPTADEAKPLADKVDAPKPVKEIAPKVADKPEIKTDSAAAPQSAPEPKSEPKSVEKAEKPKDPKPKPDQIAEELKKEEAKKPPKKPPEFKPDQIAEELKKDEAKKQRSSSKFDANQVAALLDKREPQRQVATAETLNSAASLGMPNGRANQLSQSELDALRARLSQCWSPPAGVDADSKLYVVLHVLFKPDGSLSREPEIVEDSASSLGPALSESAKRALLSCQPFTMLKPEHYDQWKDIDIKFNNELFGG
jgi:outer membrane biosynthesis protein TonB